MNRYSPLLSSGVLLLSCIQAATPVLATSAPAVPADPGEAPAAEQTSDDEAPAQDQPQRTAAITIWNGAMTDGNLGESLLFSKGFRSEYVGGVGVQADIIRGKTLGLLVDANLLGHSSAKPAQGLLETTVGLGLRAYLKPWLSFTVVEGLSWYSERSKQQLNNGGNGRQLVNYLAFELDANLSNQLSLVGRLHHRSGIYGTMSCKSACDNNAYLLGLRYTLKR